MDNIIHNLSMLLLSAYLCTIAYYIMITFWITKNFLDISINMAPMLSAVKNSVKIDCAGSKTT